MAIKNSKKSEERRTPRNKIIHYLSIVRIGMFLICSMTLLLYAAIPLIGSYIIIGKYKAREFLGNIEQIPMNAHLVFALMLLIIALLTATFCIRTYWGTKNKGVFLCTVLIDAVLCLVSIWLLSFDYNGILLWCFATLLMYFENRKSWYPTIVIAVVVYVVTYPGVASMALKKSTVDDYLVFFGSQTAIYLRSILTMLNVVCLIAFISICVLLIVNKQQRLDKIRKLADQLTYTNDKLQDTNQKLKEVMEENAYMAGVRERNRMAREVHDTLGHTLTSLIIGLDACKDLAKDSPEALDDQLDILGMVARQGIKDIRASVETLKPDSIKKRDVLDSLRTLIEDTRRTNKIDIQFTCSIKDLNVDEEEEHTIYRVVQECLDNAIQHGKAEHIKILFTKEENRIHLQIKDDGCGCPNSIEGFGLHHIRERIEMLHGTLSYDGTDGFMVHTMIPIRLHVKDDQSIDSR